MTTIMRRIDNLRCVFRGAKNSRGAGLPQRSGQFAMRAPQGAAREQFQVAGSQ